MTPGESMSTQELFDQARGQLVALEKLMAGRRNRDRACTTLTDLHVSVEALARRLQGLEFTPAPVRVDDEDEPREVPDSLSLAELMTMPADDPEIAVAERERVSVEELRLRYFRLFLDHLLVGCRSVDEVVKKLLAFARRVRPQALRELGISMAELARRTGESRAVVHAREKRLVERPLKAAGARGFHSLGGQRSEAHRAKCRQAQQGNRNRRAGEERKRRENASDRESRNSAKPTRATQENQHDEDCRD